MKHEECNHRYEITFSFTVIGFGNNEEEAIQEARDYAIQSWITNNSTNAFAVDKVAKDRYTFLCDRCEEEKFEKLEMLKLKQEKKFMSFKKAK